MARQNLNLVQIVLAMSVEELHVVKNFLGTRDRKLQLFQVADSRACHYHGLVKAKIQVRVRHWIDQLDRLEHVVFAL